MASNNLKDILLENEEIKLDENNEEKMDIESILEINTKK